jgi:hypothetical protein
MVGGVCAEERSRLTSNTSAAPTTSIMPDGAAGERNVSLRRPKKTLDSAIPSCYFSSMMLKIQQKESQ